MKSFIEQARFYQAYHTKAVTVYTHYVGVPLVVLSLMILAGFVKVIVPGVISSDLAWILTIALVVYYFVLEWRLALICVPFLWMLLWIASWFNGNGPSEEAWVAFAITFIGGWVVQLAGHIYEGRRPALFDNLFQALIAPLFLVAEILFQFGFFSNLAEKIGVSEDKKHNR